MNQPKGGVDYTDYESVMQHLSDEATRCEMLGILIATTSGILVTLIQEITHHLLS